MFLLGDGRSDLNSLIPGKMHSNLSSSRIWYWIQIFSGGTKKTIDGIITVSKSNGILVLCHQTSYPSSQVFLELLQLCHVGAISQDPVYTLIDQHRIKKIPYWTAKSQICIFVALVQRRRGEEEEEERATHLFMKIWLCEVKFVFLILRIVFFNPKSSSPLRPYQFLNFCQAKRVDTLVVL
jgi:hypothetical protein